MGARLGGWLTGVTGVSGMSSRSCLIMGVRGFPVDAPAVGMLRLFGADFASFSEIEVGRARLGFAPVAAADRFPARNVGASMAYHPVHRHHVSTLSMRAERVTDLVAPAVWRRSRVIVRFTGPAAGFGMGCGSWRCGCSRF